MNGFHPIGLRYAAGVRNFSPEYNTKDDNEQRIGAARSDFTRDVAALLLQVDF